MCVSFLGISQTQCNGLTKDSVQCKNTTKDISELCYLHNPNYKKGKCISSETVKVKVVKIRQKTKVDYVIDMKMSDKTPSI